MKKRGVRFICVMAMVMMLIACDNKDSKVNQVILSQIQEADEKELDAKESDTKESDAEAEDTETEGIGEKGVGDKTAQSVSNGAVDIDLTMLSSTMVYSEVYNMMYVPDDYIGKTVRMNGMFVVYTNQDQSLFYPAVIISDATACCSQGLEFVLEGNPVYPNEYPELGTDITVVGTFETYEEDEKLYCRLQNARVE